MQSVKRILRDYDDAGALNRFINVHAATDEHTFATKSGEPLQVIHIQGVDYEGLDPCQLDSYGHQFEAAMRLFDEQFRTYQYLIKREGPSLPTPVETDQPVLDDALRHRQEFLQSKGKSLYAVDVYIVIVYEGFHTDLKQTSRIRRLLSRQARIEEGEQLLRRRSAVLATRVESFLVQTRDLLKPRRLPTSEAFQFLRQLINFAPHQVDGVRLKYREYVDYQLCGSSLECHRDHLRLDDDFVRVLTLKEPPSHTFAHLLRGLHAIPCNIVVATEWKRQPHAGVRRLIEKKRRHYFNSKTSLMTYLNSSAPQDTLVDDSAAGMVKSLGACLEETELRGNHFGLFSLTVVLHHQEADRVTSGVAECFKVFTTHDAQLTEERYNQLNAFLSILPGNHLFNLRRLWLLNTNYNDLSFIFTLHSGEKQNDHLRAPCLAVLETNHGTPYFFNLHYQDIAHALLVGATGSGKSFLLNFLITHSQQYKPYTYIFDLGHSYQTLTRSFAGSYLPIGTQHRSFTINPFVLPPSPNHLQFLFSFVRVLIEANGYRMSAPEEKDLFDQIENLYAIEPEQRRLFTLANTLARPLRLQLEKWIEGGPFGSWFDNVQDNLTFSRFQTIDFLGLDAIPQVLEPLLFYLLHRASASIAEESARTTFKVFVIDEAWRFLRHPVIKNYVTEALKTWRKNNAALLLATQSIDDLTHTDMLGIVAESCMTKIFLANPGFDRQLYRTVFHLTETEAELMSNLVPKQQFLLKRPDRTKVLTLQVEEKSYWIYTNDPFDNEKKREALDRDGLQGLDTLTRSPA